MKKFAWPAFAGGVAVGMLVITALYKGWQKFGPATGGV
jgi:hypothetical protein